MSATARQIKFIRDLLVERDLFASEKFMDQCGAMDATELSNHMAHLHDCAGHCTFEQADKWIKRLLQLPKLSEAPFEPTPEQKLGWAADQGVRVDTDRRILLVDGTEVPNGSYALETPESRFTNDTTFFKVWVGDRGGWNIKVVHGPDESPIGRNIEILRRIAADASGAASRYGLAIGKCGVCGRRLTNDESRERGIGPICADRYGW